MKKIIKLLMVGFLLTACAHKKEMKVNSESIQPGTSVQARGEQLKLYKGEVKVGDNFYKILQDTDLQFSKGDKVTIVSIVPSIDTLVCEEQTHILGENKSLGQNIERVTISRDLPMAQARFAKVAKLDNVTYLSDYKTASFGKKTGLLIEKSALLTRGILVIDKEGVIRYIQLVSELSQLPDMDKAIQFANELSEKDK